MTLIKSLLLGSAAGLVAVASAQAADLPTRKGAPAAEYVRICSITVAGKPIVGWTLPGSDTCFKIGGYLTAQVEGGNLQDGQSLRYSTPLSSGGVPAGTQFTTNGENRDGFGYTTRANIALDAASNTAYGPLYAHIEMQFESGNGFDNTGSGAYLNLAYLTWAGITAGKAPSFYSFTGGGPGWANFFSPDQQGFNQPDLIAYTASFGGGFSASIALQSAGENCPGFTGSATAGATQNVPGFGCSGGGTNVNDIGPLNYINDGMRWPDIVANLKVSQGWGSAQISGVAHNVRATATPNSLSNGNLNTIDTWGWGIDGGVSFNLPMIGAGDSFLLTGSWTRNAVWYSGIPDGMWGEEGAVNGNGQQMAVADTYAWTNPVTGNVSWAVPTAWSIAATATFQITPEFTLQPEISYAQINWSNVSGGFGAGLGQTVSNSQSWIGGLVGHWDPVKNLDFELELLYQGTHTDQPDGFCSALRPVCATSLAGQNNSWQPNANGFATRFEITRNF